MMRAIMWAIIAGALVLAGCKEADKPARVDDKPVAPKPDEKPVKVVATPPVVEGTLDGAPIRYLSALALFNDDEVSIQLFPGTIDCDKERPDSTNRLAFTVNSGPERTFYAGRDLAVRVSIDGVSTWFSPAAATVKLAPFAPKQGARLTGTIAFDAKADGKAYKVAGRFDAQLCRSYEPTPPALPAAAPAGPVTGAVGDEKFTAQFVVAVVEHDTDLDVDGVSELWLLPVPAIPCADLWRFFYGHKANALRFVAFGGANSRQKWPGVAQPADMMWDPVKGTSLQRHGKGWLKLDSIDLTDGATLSGSLAHLGLADNGFPASAFAGTFRATVCRR